MLPETVLAPCLLDYGRKCVFWKCVSGEDVDVSSMDWNGYCASVGLTTIRPTPDGRIIRPKLNMQSADMLSTYDSQQAEWLPQHFRTWKLVAKDYLSRRLTNPMDKLFALSGIVSYFRDAMQGSYPAGLWKKQLLHELSWMTPETASRPDVWRSPSWSWVCLNRAVAFQSRPVWMI